MGRVMAAHDRVLDRPVAVKLLREELLDDPVHRRRLLREARGAARLQHPNVVAVHDVSADDDTPYLVLERVDGETLADVLRREAPLSVPRTLVILDGVLAGLAAAHDRGLVHRDVKPANVLLAADGTPKLADFGIARVLEDASSQLTTTHQVMGTPRYLAPEQAAGRAPGAPADVYAVGVLAYECLAGRTPFDGDSAIAIALAHQQQPVPPLVDAAPGVPPAVARVVEQALAKDPAERFADAGALRAALARAGDEQATPTAVLPPLAPAPTSAPAPQAVADEQTARMDPAEQGTDAAAGPRRPLAMAALVVGLAVVVALGATVLGGDRRSTDGPDGTDPASDAAADGTEDPADDPPATDEAGPEDAPAEPPADDPPPAAIDDLDDLIAALEVEPARAGEKGPDLLDDARAVRDEQDEETRRTEARILVTEIADWLASDELDREVGRAALGVLEDVGRPPEPRLEEANALFVEVARDLAAWGEDADTVLSGLEDLLELTAPGRITGEATELADELETRADDGTLDADRTADAVAVLRRTGS
jgi:hypothetical protein